MPGKCSLTGISSTWTPATSGQTAELQKIGVNVNQIARRINSTGTVYAQDIEAVSYTHLDVYKRQGHNNLIDLIGKRGYQFICCRQDAPITISIFYIHQSIGHFCYLDVYKRQPMKL